MNIAIILSGGTGTRLGYKIPKQYIEINKKPIIQHCIETFERNTKTDQIVVVAATEWQAYIDEIIKKQNITKFFSFAEAGSSRQHSIVNGLEVIYKANFQGKVNVIIHDAARPNLTNETINKCYDGLLEADGVMPVLPVKDTMYLSEDGKTIKSLLNRDQLFGGQAPESFDFEKYYKMHAGLTEQELSLVRGSSEIAYRNGLKMLLIAGDEHNYKITTESDLEKFKMEIGE